MNPVGFMLFGNEADPGVAVVIAPQPAAGAAVVTLCEHGSASPLLDATFAACAALDGDFLYFNLNFAMSGLIRSNN